MTSIVLLVLALLASYLAARRSLVKGLAVVLTVGYVYGIVRANRLDGYSHLLFDAALQSMATLVCGDGDNSPTEYRRYVDIEGFFRFTGVTVDGATAGFAVYHRLPVVIPAYAIPTALGGAVVVGVVAGIYPSIRAARMTPTAALSSV